jgi:hypothetical protein
MNRPAKQWESRDKTVAMQRHGNVKPLNAEVFNTQKRNLLRSVIFS